jgi:hypothetical protein
VTNIAAPIDLYYVLGPSVGYNKEVLLWDPSRWRVPNQALIDEIFRVTGFPNVTAQELRNFGERQVTPEYRAPQIRLQCAVLSAPRFRDLGARLVQHDVSMFRFFMYRDIVRKTALFDWLTVGALLFVFEHLDR